MNRTLLEAWQAMSQPERNYVYLRLTGTHPKNPQLDAQLAKARELLRDLETKETP